MAIVIKNAITYLPRDIKLWDLYLLGSKGKDSVQASIGVRRGMLQRKLQQDEWRNNENQRVKEYLFSLVQGSAVTDSFMIVPIELVLSSLRSKLEDAIDDSEKETIQDTIQDIETDSKEGVEFYLLDGQNRLFEAITPFFDNEVALSNLKQIAIDTNTNKEISLSGKLFKDLPKVVQSFLKNMSITIHQATQGDIDQLISSLIAKNSGVTWIDWQILMTKNTFTKFRKQIGTVTDDSLVVDKVLSKITKSEYAYRKDGYELFISELLIWMKTQTQPKTASTNMQTQFFKGEDGNVISDSMVNSLKKYLREFAKSDVVKKLTSHITVRNYVMLRYALDYPKQFSTTNVPSWKIVKHAEFVAKYIMVHEAAYRDENAYSIITDSKGKFIKKDKVPGHLPYYNSSYDKDLLLGRLECYFVALKDLEQLMVDTNIITVQDTTPMPSILEVAENNDMKDYNGAKLLGVELVSGKFDRGHVKPQSKGGSNLTLKPQTPKSNKQYGATAL